MVAIDEFRPAFGILPFLKVAPRVDAAPDPLTRLQYQDLKTRLMQDIGRGEARKPGTDDDDVRRLHHTSLFLGDAGTRLLLPS
jgi:hypothetical protein